MFIYMLVLIFTSVSCIICFRCLMEEKKMIDTMRNIEFFNSVFLCTEDATIILKYSKTIFSHLESLMLTLTNVVDFDCKIYLPIGVITALVGSLFGNLMKFYREEIYKHVQQSNENLTIFRSDTKILHDCLMKIWINLSKGCNNCIHGLVLESLSNCIVYLELEEIDQKDLFSLCSGLIDSDYYPIEITAYTILDRFVNKTPLHKNYNVKLKFHFVIDYVSYTKLM